jgi:hypothetical protein
MIFAYLYSNPPFIRWNLQELAMRKQLVLVIPLLAAMIGMFAIVGLNSVNAQNMSTPETNMTSMTNATVGGNMTGSENMTNTSSPMMSNSS